MMIFMSDGRRVEEEWVKWIFVNRYVFFQRTDRGIYTMYRCCWTYRLYSLVVDSFC